MTLTQPSNARGFTLLEIMIALAILSLTLTSLYIAEGATLRASRQAESVQTASLLARQKMAEKLIELRREISKDSMPDEQKNDEGAFDPPFDRYRWKLEVRKIGLPSFDPQTGSSGNVDPNAPVQEKIPPGVERAVFQVISKKLEESVREIRLTILWDDLEEERTFVVTTHLARL